MLFVVSIRVASISKVAVDADFLLCKKEINSAFTLAKPFKYWSGEVYTECVHMLRSMTAEDVNEKFRRLSTAAVSPELYFASLELADGLANVLPDGAALR